MKDLINKIKNNRLSEDVIKLINVLEHGQIEYIDNDGGMFKLKDKKNTLFFIYDEYNTLLFTITDISFYLNKKTILRHDEQQEIIKITGVAIKNSKYKNYNVEIRKYG